MMWQKQAADRLWYQTAFEVGTDDYRPLTAFGGAALGSGVVMEPDDWDDLKAAATHDAQAAAFLIGWAVALLGSDDEAEHNSTMTRVMNVLSGSTEETAAEPSPLPTGKVPTGEPIRASSKNPPIPYIGSGEDVPCPHDWLHTRLDGGVLYETCRLCGADRSGPPIPAKPGGPPEAPGEVVRGTAVQSMTRDEFFQEWGINPEEIEQVSWWTDKQKQATKDHLLRDVERVKAGIQVGVDLAKGESHTVKQPMRRVPAVSGAEETWEPDGPPIHLERDASRDEVQTGEGKDPDEVDNTVEVLEIDEQGKVHLVEDDGPHGPDLLGPSPPRAHPNIEYDKGV